jgi:hypothetical protein
MKKILILTTALMTPSLVAAQDITFMSWGGAYEVS